MIYFSPLKERCETLASYMLECNSTVRATAAHFGISKSTVHKDVTKTLKVVNPGLCAEVSQLLEQNKSERHIRGGEATRRKYEHSKVSDTVRSAQKTSGE